MNIITTTQLRTKSSSLVKNLQAGQSFHLIHRSQNIATILPQPSQNKITDHSRLAKNIQALNLPYLSPNQVKSKYNKHLMKKYGKSIS